MSDMVNILGVKFNNLTMDQIVSKTIKATKKKSQTILAFSNPEFVIDAQKNKFLRTYLNNVDYNLADGVGVILASKLLGKPLKERITGTDFTPAIVKTGIKIFLLGGKDGVAEQAKEKLEEKFENANIVGTQHGYSKDRNRVLKKINKSGAKVLMVCLGCPKQEDWIMRSKEDLNTKVIFGNGGALDFWSGDVKRAPKWMIKLGLEWLYRLTQDFNTTRIKRQLKLFKFGWLVIKKKMLKR